MTENRSGTPSDDSLSNADIIRSLLVKSKPHVHREVTIRGHRVLNDGRVDTASEVKIIIDDASFRWQLIRILRSGKAEECENIIIELEDETRIALVSALTVEDYRIANAIKECYGEGSVDIKESDPVAHISIWKLFCEIFPDDEGYEKTYETECNIADINIPTGLDSRGKIKYFVLQFDLNDDSDIAIMVYLRNFDFDMDLILLSSQDSEGGVKVRKLLAQGFEIARDDDILNKHVDLNNIDELRRELEILKSVLIA